MKIIKKKWTFLSNHGRVLAYLARNKQTTSQVIAYETGLSMREVQKLIDDLEKDGYITKEKVGRCNRYEVIPEMPLRHRLERRHTIGELLSALGCNRPGRGKESNQAQDPSIISNMSTS
jgi:DNA-binding Lrp family transcriptional regulator